MNINIMTALATLENELELVTDRDEKIQLLNHIRQKLSKASPFSKYEPVDCVLWVKSEYVKANDYNPNSVASPEMKLLHTSIKIDGYTQPIVVHTRGENDYEVTDGFHRNVIGKEYPDIAKRTGGYLPIANIDKPFEERMGSTIRHNRARGTHQIRSMSHIVVELFKAGWSDEDICKKLGMELDEVIRLKQISGLQEAFQNHEFSQSWEEFEQKYYSGETDLETSNKE